MRSCCSSMTCARRSGAAASGDLTRFRDAFLQHHRPRRVARRRGLHRRPARQKRASGQDSTSQLTTFRSGTRPNSASLFVTSVAPTARACAAISRSLAPMSRPLRVSPRGSRRSGPRRPRRTATEPAAIVEWRLTVRRQASPGRGLEIRGPVLATRAQGDDFSRLDDLDLRRFESTGGRQANRRKRQDTWRGRARTRRRRARRVRRPRTGRRRGRTSRGRRFRPRRAAGNVTMLRPESAHRGRADTR